MINKGKRLLDLKEIKDFIQTLNDDNILTIEIYQTEYVTTIKIESYK